MKDPVPPFPHFRKLTLADKELFSSYFAKNPPETSEYSFANFYIWRNCDRSEITFVNGNICVCARPGNELPYFFEPMGANDIEGTIKICLSHIPRFSRISEKFMKKHFEGKAGYKIEAIKDHYDYLYKTVDLIALKGKRYDGKRNRIKRLLKNNIPIYQKLTSDMVPDCLKLLNKWSKAKASGVCFDEPIKEALNNFKDLGAEGAAVRIKGMIEAFTIGEHLNRDTAVIYIEVADPEIDGLSQYINQQFCRNEWADVPFINREEDMGNAGLRKAKLSYHPIQLIKKFDVVLV